MKFLLPNKVLQFGGVDCGSRELRFPMVHRGSVMVKEKPEQPVICPTLHFLHDSSYYDIMDVQPAGDEIVNQMPLLGPGVHPHGLLLVHQSEEYVDDGEVIFSTLCE